MRQTKAKKVFVGLSGGVDSSVSAALLKNAATPEDFEKIFGRASPEGFSGFDVTGVFIRVWQPDFFECTWKDDRLDAMRVCAKLAIPFVELDLEKEYKKEVVDYMIREYSVGKTPNPDVMCNRYIKFGGFYNWAMKQGADFVATGHYARIRMREARNSKHEALRSRLRTSNFELLTSSDPDKDQSYFLWQIKKEQLPHILFPVGGMKKPEVRKLAKKFGLITADKKDSQGLCFVGKVDMKEFLSHYITPKKGRVLSQEGKIIGEHFGAFFYTMGERVGNLPSFPRRGLGGGSSEHPQYVISKDIKKNTLTVSHKSPKGALSGAVTEVLIKNCNWLTPPMEGKTYLARTRYRQPLESCKFEVNSSKVIFDRPQTAASGQSLVLYDGDVLIGGGIIA